MTRLRIGLLLLLLPACNAAVDPIVVGPGCPEQPLRGPQEWAAASPEAVLDDFEDGNLLLMRVAGRVGSWYSFPVSSPMAVGAASRDCAASGMRSGRFIVSGGAGDMGANWNATMIDPFTAVVPYDASAWGGFSLWIAAGDTAGAATELTIGIQTTDVVDAGGVCTMCGDYHLKAGIPLTRTWTRWSFRFEELQQRGFGVPQVPLRPDRIVNFIFWPRSPFDIWIDDFRFEP